MTGRERIEAKKDPNCKLCNSQGLARTDEDDFYGNSTYEICPCVAPVLQPIPSQPCNKWMSDGQMVPVYPGMTKEHPTWLKCDRCQTSWDPEMHGNMQCPLCYGPVESHPIQGVVKNKSTQQGKELWDHVESIAEQVRAAHPIPSVAPAARLKDAEELLRQVERTYWRIQRVLYATEKQEWDRIRYFLGIESTAGGTT